MQPLPQDTVKMRMHGGSGISFFSRCILEPLSERPYRFIQIEYFFDDKSEMDSQGKPTKKLHGIWFAHGPAAHPRYLISIETRCVGSETIVKELAHGQQLFLLEECDDIRVSTIFRKCNVRQLGVREAEPPDMGDDATDYFYAFVPLRPFTRTTFRRAS